MKLLLLLLGLLFCHSLVFAAISCEDANKVEVHDTDTGTSYSVAYTTPSPCTNCVTFWGLGGRALVDRSASDVQMGGQSMTIIETRQYNGQSLGSLYYLKAPPSGTNNLTATLSGGMTNRNLIIWTCTGVDQTTPLGDTGVATGVSTAPSVTLTPVDSTQTVIDYIVSDDQTSLSAGANQTVIHQGDSGSSLGGASYQAGADGGVMSWTLGGSDDWVIVGAVLNAASRRGVAPLVY